MDVGSKFTVCTVSTSCILVGTVPKRILPNRFLLLPRFRQVQAVVHDRRGQEQLLEVLRRQSGRRRSGRGHLSIHRLSSGLCQVRPPRPPFNLVARFGTRSYKKDDELLPNLPGAVSSCTREKVLISYVHKRGN